MSKITTIGLDLAKHVFHVVCCDARGKVVGKKALKRGQVLTYFANERAAFDAGFAVDSQWGLPDAFNPSDGGIRRAYRDYF